MGNIPAVSVPTWKDVVDSSVWKQVAQSYHEHADRQEGAERDGRETDGAGVAEPERHHRHERDQRHGEERADVEAECAVDAGEPAHRESDREAEDDSR